MTEEEKDIEMLEEEEEFKKEEEEEEEFKKEEEEEEFKKKVVVEEEKRVHLCKIINNFAHIVHDVRVDWFLSGPITITIPSSLLPITLRIAYGFSDDDTLFQISLMLKDYRWTKKPVCEIKNPFYIRHYGKCLVEDAKDNFFKSTFKPKPNYRSAPIFVDFHKPFHEEILQKIIDLGFTQFQAIRAASLLNDYDQCVTFLQTGQYPHDSPFRIPASYKECPLLYFVLEIFDAVLNLQDHCCFCGKKIAAGLRANTCDDLHCRFGFINFFEVCLSKEIKKDPAMVDLLFSVFSFQNQTEHFNLEPSLKLEQTLEEIIRKMPAMSVLANCNDGHGFINKTDREAFFVLRWVFSTCRSIFLSLPPSLEFSSFRRKDDIMCHQFMALTASPEQEMIFQQMKKKYGSIFLWHASPTIRYHIGIDQKSIFGNDDGSGIYFTSVPRPSHVKNGYKNSMLGDDFTLVSLVEVINLPEDKEEIVNIEFNNDETGTKIEKKFKGLLKKIDTFGYTLKFDEIEGDMKDLASIVRFIFVNLPENAPSTINKEDIPTLNKVLSLRAKI